MAMIDMYYLYHSAASL